MPTIAILRARGGGGDTKSQLAPLLFLKMKLKSCTAANAPLRTKCTKIIIRQREVRTDTRLIASGQMPLCKVLFISLNYFWGLGVTTGENLVVYSGLLAANEGVGF